MKWLVYIVECSNRSLYTGITNNLDRRIQEHNSKEGARYTRAFRPVKLLWSEGHRNRSSALKREAQIKKWTRGNKEALIKGDLELLKKYG